MSHFVYFDSHRRTFSVRDETTRKVTQKSDVVVLSEAQFRVSERGRLRVLREGRKMVHAGILGTVVVPNGLPSTADLTAVRYNPKSTASFVRADNNEPVFGSERVVCLIENGRARVFALLPSDD